MFVAADALPRAREQRNILRSYRYSMLLNKLQSANCGSQHITAAASMAITPGRCTNTRIIREKRRKMASTRYVLENIHVQLTLILTAVALVFVLGPSHVSAFVPFSSSLHPRPTGIINTRAYSSSTSLQMSAYDDRPLWSITLPLLDASPEASSTLNAQTIVPLPSSHLPDELTTLNLYGFEVSAPVHKMLIDESIKTAGIYIAEEGDMPKVLPGSYGHLVSRGDDGGELVGSIGCAVDVVMATPAQSPGLNIEKEMDDMIGAATKGDFSAKDRDSVGEDGTSKGEEESLVVLVRGSFRFVVREVIKTIPYIVAVVDELRDDEPGAVKTKEEAVAQVEEVAESTDSNAPSDGIFYNDFEDFGGAFVKDEKSTDTEATINSETDAEDDDEEDEDDDDIYSDLSTQELVQRSMAAMKAIVDQKLQSATTAGMTPLEMSILEDAGMPIPNRDAQRSQAEEYGAVLEIFRSELIDICQTPKDIYYAVGMLTAEMADANNEMRTKCLITTDGVERLRMILRLAEDRINKVAAQRLTEQITEEVSADEKDLKVGKAVIPQWAYQMRVSYFWNEIEGWCKGYVSEDPIKIGDELIIAVTFDDDGSTHKLPFLAEEKVRWRPGDMDD